MISVTYQTPVEYAESDEVWTHDLEKEMFSDEVNKPAHYNTGSIECIEYLEDNLSSERFRGYLEGNTKKYLHRFRYKGKAKQDLQKAQWYLDRLIEAEDSPDTYVKPSEEEDQYVIDYLLAELRSIRKTKAADEESRKVEEALVTILRDWYMTEEQFNAENV